jgi:hypothetical protein
LSLIIYNLRKKEVLNKLRTTIKSKSNRIIILAIFEE